MTNYTWCFTFNIQIHSQKINEWRRTKTRREERERNKCKALYLCNFHDFDSCQLACLDMTTLEKKRKKNWRSQQTKKQCTEDCDWSYDSNDSKSHKFSHRTLPKQKNKTKQNLNSDLWLSTEAWMNWLTQLELLPRSCMPLSCCSWATALNNGQYTSYSEYSDVWSWPLTFGYKMSSLYLLIVWIVD